MATFEGSYPFTALPNWILEKRASEKGWLSCSELSVLFALQYFAAGMGAQKGVYPSYKTICLYADVSKPTAINCINSLQEKGLIEKVARKNEQGDTSNVYYLRHWEAPMWPTSVKERAAGGSPERPQEGVKKFDPPCQTALPEQEPINKTIPPLSPLPPGTAEADGGQQPPQSPAEASPNRLRVVNGATTPPPPREGLPGAHSSQLPPQRQQQLADHQTPAARVASGSNRQVALAPMVPSDLQPVANLICEFFNNHKGGSKTTRAFDGLISNLQRILKDECGGIKEVERQLREGIDKSLSGEKKWESIRFSNWEKYGKKQQPAWAVNNRPATLHIENSFEEDAAIFF